MSSYPGRESKTTGESLLCPVEFRLTSSVCASPLRVVASNSAGLRWQRALCSRVHVVPADVFDGWRGGPPSGPYGPGLGIVQLSFDPGEEALGEGSPSTGRCARRTRRTGSPGPGRRSGGYVLAAPVGLEDNTRVWAAGGDGVGQSVRDELDSQVIGQGVPGNAP